MFEFNTNAVVTMSLLGLFLTQTMLCQLGILSPLHYYHSVPLIIRHGEVWRIITSIFYLGPTIDIEYTFHLLFFLNYSTQLELVQFRNKRVDFIFMLFFITTALNIVPSVLASTTSFVTSGSLVLSGAFIHTIVYIWSRHNQHFQMALFGIISFTAPYLPLVLLVFSYLFGSRNVENEIIGIFIGHVYFFFKFVTPIVFHKDYLPTPRWFHFIFTYPFGNFEQNLQPEPIPQQLPQPLPQQQPQLDNPPLQPHITTPLHDTPTLQQTPSISHLPSRPTIHETTPEFTTNYNELNTNFHQNCHDSNDNNDDDDDDDDDNDDDQHFPPKDLYR